MVSRGTAMPPEHREVSSAELTETFTKHVRGERLSMAATIIDFSYLRAITRERDRSIDLEREAYQHYIRSQTTFYVHLVLHGRESCRSVGGSRDDNEEESGEVLDFRSWDFTLRDSSGDERQPSELEPGPTQLAPSGGCLVQGYVHFEGNIGRREEWVELESSFGGEDRRYRADLRWDVQLYQPPRRRRPPDERRRRGRRPPRDDDRRDDERRPPRDDDRRDDERRPPRDDDRRDDERPSARDDDRRDDERRSDDRRDEARPERGED